MKILTTPFNILLTTTDGALLRNHSVSDLYRFCEDHLDNWEGSLFPQQRLREVLGKLQWRNFIVFAICREDMEEYFTNLYKLFSEIQRLLPPTQTHTTPALLRLAKIVMYRYKTIEQAMAKNIIPPEIMDNFFFAHKSVTPIMLLDLFPKLVHYINTPKHKKLKDYIKYA